MSTSHPIDRLVASSLQGRVPLVIFIFALLSGVLALKFTAREEEPQIVVPMLDILVSVPNINANQVERQVTIPLEKLLAQVPGVEHVYSVTQTGGTTVTLRFYVGEDREKAILNTYNKLYANQNSMPNIVANWQVKPIEVDDVAIMMLGLWSEQPQLYDDYELRRIAQEVSTHLQAIDDTSEVKVIGGRQRSMQVYLNATNLAAFNTTVMDVYNAINVSNQLAAVGVQVSNSESVVLEVGDVFRQSDELNHLVVNVINGKPVYLSDVATIQDGPSEATSYQWYSEASANSADHPMVTISIAKQAGSNAVNLANKVLESINALKGQLIPKHVNVAVLRNYGETANEKVNNLVSSLAFAVFTVVVFIGVFLGWRPAIVVGLAVPICYGLTLILDMAFGYTINRVTLFALILSLGLLVDDPITGIDNIKRFMLKGDGKTSQIVAAMSEIRPALIMSTVTIVLAFVPMAFITGMMGPYMAPMAFNVPVSVIVSTLVALFVTPWLASKLLKDSTKQQESSNSGDLYHKILTPILASKSRAKTALWLTLGLFIASALLPVFRTVPLKLLPFDNKNEVQILIDLPESASLEQSAALSGEIAQQVKRVAEVKAVAVYVGEPSAIDFNGMVRQYYMRTRENLAEIRVLLVDKSEREHQSHGVVLRLRELLAPFNKDGVNVKVVEVPPGPPVLSTLVAEVYRDPFVALEQQQLAARNIAVRLASEPHVVEVDTTMQAKQQINRFVVDKEKAALSGIATEDIKRTLMIAGFGVEAGSIANQYEAEPLAIKLRIPYQTRNQASELDGLYIRGREGIAQTDLGLGLEAAPQPLVALSELGQYQTLNVTQPIYRKDLQSVIYVTAELNGRAPAEVVADINADQREQLNDQQTSHVAWQERHYLNNGGGELWSIPQGTWLTWSGEGELRITARVFRDMGIAFAFALTGIFFILRLQTGSYALSGIIMSAIPLTVIGIMPGFWLMNQFGEREIAASPEPVLFTATAMIGMIALAGIVVRNSLILVEFISAARAQGAAIKEALLMAGSVRMRPVLLTAGTTLLGNLVIILDPVFSGLALAIIFGIISSTLFSLIIVPAVYYLVFDDTKNSAQDAQEQ